MEREWGEWLYNGNWLCGVCVFVCFVFWRFKEMGFWKVAFPMKTGKAKQGGNGVEGRLGPQPYAALPCVCFVISLWTALSAL